MKNRTNSVVWVAIVLAVVIFLVFLTISGKKDSVNWEGVNNVPEVSASAGGESITNSNEEFNNIDMEEQSSILDPDKLKITIEREGTGEGAKGGDVVVVNYTGRLADGSVFDSNILPEFGHVEPFAFELGSGSVIQGWEMGILGMREGGKRVLEISPEYGYGDRGAGSLIPPGATLVFEVELISVISNY